MYSHNKIAIILMHRTYDVTTRCYVTSLAHQNGVSHIQLRYQLSIEPRL